jgi:predicted GIY-YIG superfamily endonuclease
VATELNWDECQRRSDQILAEGLFLLKSQDATESSTVGFGGPGNYLLSLDDTPQYIGEAKIVAGRVRQQFKPKTSTFYRTYANGRATCRPIGDFRVRHIEATVGRTELEEFGIVNAKCPLNKFQRGKRAVVADARTSALWAEVQHLSGHLIAQGEATALNTSPKAWREASANICAGLYLIRAPIGDDLLYIGEASDVSDRHKCHGGKKAYFSALRRPVGTDVLGFCLTERNGKAKYFSDDEEKKITDFLHTCRIACLPVNFGRLELEEYLIRKLRPTLNRKDNAD